MKFATFRFEMSCNRVGEVSEDPTACRLEIQDLPIHYKPWTEVLLLS